MERPRAAATVRAGALLRATRPSEVIDATGVPASSMNSKPSAAMQMPSASAAGTTATRRPRTRVTFGAAPSAGTVNALSLPFTRSRTFERARPETTRRSPASATSEPEQRSSLEPSMAMPSAWNAMPDAPFDCVTNTRSAPVPRSTLRPSPSGDGSGTSPASSGPKELAKTRRRRSESMGANGSCAAPSAAVAPAWVPPKTSRKKSAREAIAPATSDAERSRPMSTGGASCCTSRSSSAVRALPPRAPMRHASTTPSYIDQQLLTLTSGTSMPNSRA